MIADSQQASRKCYVNLVKKRAYVLPGIQGVHTRYGSSSSSYLISISRPACFLLSQSHVFEMTYLVSTSTTLWMHTSPAAWGKRRMRRIPCRGLDESIRGLDTPWHFSIDFWRGKGEINLYPLEPLYIPSLDLLQESLSTYDLHEQRYCCSIYASLSNKTEKHTIYLAKMHGTLT